MLAASSRKRNVTVWGPSVRLSVLTAHIQGDSPVTRGQHATQF